MLINVLTIFKIEAQNIVVEETFDSNELGWAENVKPSAGEAIIVDGEFKFAPTNSYFSSQNTTTPNLLYSDGVMPIDPLQGFEISVDMTMERLRILGASLDGWANVSCGLLLEFDDEYNFIAVACSERTCYILFYQEGRLIRYKTTAIKMKGVEKKTATANLKVIYKDYKLKVLIDDVEMTEIRKVNIESPYIALFATGKKVQFDNLIISQ